MVATAVARPGLLTSILGLGLTGQRGRLGNIMPDARLPVPGSILGARQQWGKGFLGPCRRAALDHHETRRAANLSFGNNEFVAA